MLPLRFAPRLALLDAGGAAGRHLGAVHVPREVRVPVDVHVHVAAAPVAVAPHRRPHCHADAEGQRGSAPRVARRVGRVGRVGRVRPRPVDDRGIVRRHVDDLRACRLDLDDSGGLLNHHGLRARCRRRRRRGGLDRHFLLGGGLQIPLRLRPGAQALDGIQHALLVGQERVAQLLGPVELLVQQVEDLGKGGERFDAVVPRLVLELLVELIAREVRIGLDESRGLDDLQRIGGSHQHLRQQGVRIQGDRRRHLLELLRGKGRNGAARLRRRARLGGGRQRAGQRQRQEPGEKAGSFHHRDHVWFLPRVATVANSPVKTSVRAPGRHREGPSRAPPHQPGLAACYTGAPRPSTVARIGRITGRGSRRWSQEVQLVVHDDAEALQQTGLPRLT